ncbi:hypothetical protein Taro_007636 [Colocasia esculenta]|uniref:BED-type domain-containing protein n=1 Tax=Colocasia esculenta TaxID=4460 RepID=A0A843U0X4_COLES|nr:hypothetical protein [Colocasia esculenta]
MSKPQLSFPSHNRTPKHHGCLNTLHQTLGTSFRTCWGRVEELLVAKELWNDHKKLIFFPVASAATCTDSNLEVDQSMSDTVDMDVEESVCLDTQVRDVSTSSSTKGRRLRSLVWNDFTRERQGDDGFVAICNHCQKVFSGGSQHETTHLKKHLRICIPYQDARRGKSGDNEDFKFNQELSREKLAHMLAMHEYPFSMVEHCGFMDFAKSLQPQFKMFTRNTHKEDCIKLYEKKKDKMCKFFNKITFRVTLTADIWTSSNMVGYISLTCHFVDDDWRLQKKILNFLSFEYPHSGEEIYKTIKKLLVDWNLDKRLCSIVLDNALSNDKFVRELIKDLSLNMSLLLDGEFFRVRCCAHILNLIVQDGLKEIGDELAKIRKIVRYIRFSTKKIQDFKKVAMQEGILSKGLILDVPTRWNSTYLMLERACEFQEIVRRFICFDDDVHLYMLLEE